MIALLFVADGPRDEAALPPLVKGILDREIRSEFQPWARLHRGGKGYGRKLKFAVRQARFAKLEGVVAVVDRDRDDDRLKALTSARGEDRREAPPFPTALGCAVPHVERWLVSDRAALEEHLSCGPEELDELQRSGKPKQHLDRILNEQRLDKLESLRSLASRLSVARCRRAADSGLADFAEEVEAELGSLRR
jgi:hypothetical protein